MPFPAFPASPEIPDTRRASGQVPIRFEDVTQDGRLALEGLAPALGEVVWRRLLTGSSFLKALHAHHAVPILTRVVIEGGDGPFSTFKPLEATGTYDVAHVANDAGQVERILLDMWIDATLPIGRNYGPPPERAGERIRAGRFFGEHVLTRLFAPPDQRKVTHLEDGGAPLIGRRRAWVSAESVGTLPEGAAPLDEALRVDPTPIAFGIAHTDSNQHVNSLVYPRLFEDAALRRFASLGKLKPSVLSRHVEAAFRKPCFAGETYAVALQAFTLDGRLGAVGAFVSSADAQSPETLAKAKANCFVRMMFE
jgi:acyl-CoA thioesterase FadM